MRHDDLAQQIQRLLAGLADQANRSGKTFFYDGGRLYPDEVAKLVLASAMCLAQDIAERLGLGNFGFRFELRATDDGLPLAMEPAGTPCLFLEVAPFVTEVFEGEVIDCCDDLARVFECAARVLKDGFSLERDTTYVG